MENDSFLAQRRDQQACQVFRSEHVEVCTRTVSDTRSVLRFVGPLFAKCCTLPIQFCSCSLLVPRLCNWRLLVLPAG